MKFKAVCIRCGAFKKDAFATCKQCELTPKTDFEAARALILSEKNVYGDVVIGKTAEELQMISESIRAGRPFPIDGDEQTRVVRAYYAYLKTLPQKKWYQRRKNLLITITILALVVVAGFVSYFLLFKY